MHYGCNITGKNIETRVGRILRCIKREKIKYNSIVVRGVSGMSVGFPLAVATGKNVCVVRKEGDKHHAISKIYTGSLKEPALIVDDFMDSGETVKTIVEKLKNPGTATVILYDQARDNSWVAEKEIPIYGVRKK